MGEDDHLADGHHGELALGAVQKIAIVVIHNSSRLDVLPARTMRPSGMLVIVTPRSALVRLQRHDKTSRYLSVMLTKK